MDVGWYRGDEDRAGNSTDDDYYVAKIDGRVLPDLSLGLLAIWAELGDNDITGADWTGVIEYREYDAQYYYVGTTSNFDNGMLFGGYDFIYQGGDIEFQDDATLAEVKDLDRKA